ncbi:tyrosine-protein phosphatase 69D isoform X2 [Stomoxys calcitrans]|uniref:tyrosine-protein phosphatase 69D isoform X2 n=1 Tax=Stomoxys calcitrans TaxID=35570 RepID=UPI0027E2491F|nr:tyrosine-protein phosphatase 69D isoform X2 [Stomoxys calcitrans]
MRAEAFLQREWFLQTLEYVICIAIVLVGCDCQTPNTEGLQTVHVGGNVTINCYSSNKNITWKFKDRSIDVDNKRTFTGVVRTNNTNEISEMQEIYEISLSIANVQISDEGIYICETIDNIILRKVFLQPFIAPKIVDANGEKVKQKIGHSVKLYCVIEIYPQNDTLDKQLQWLKDENAFSFLDKSANIENLNSTHINYTLELTEVYKKENGTYACVSYLSSGEELARTNIALLVMDVPKVSIDYVKAVGASKIYLNWTINDGNDPVQKYFIQYLQRGNPDLTYYKDVIGGGNTSYVLENFLPNTSYFLRMSAKNSIGNGTPFQYPLAVTTLEKDPIFIPKVKTTGSTASTITIGWDPPPLDLFPYVQYYELVVSEAGEKPKIIEEAVYQQNSRNLPYMFDNLKTATEYEFKVRACSDLTKLCGPWSDIVNGTTMDGVSSKPKDLKVFCIHNNMSNINTVDIGWVEPEKPNGKVVSYQIQLEGISSYNRNGKIHTETWGPKIRRIDEPQHHTSYDGVISNTNYTVTVSAITRHRKNGEPATAKCTMPVSVPDVITRVMWTKVRINEEKCVFKVFVPRVSERNGPICCYRLYLIRMKNNIAELPPPNKINISTYHKVHSPNNSVGGAYLAEMFPGSNFKSEIFLGDGKRYFEISYPSLRNSIEDIDKQCLKCVEGEKFVMHNSPAKNSQKTVRNKTSALRAYSSYFEIITPVTPDEVSIENELKMIIFKIFIQGLAIMIGIALIVLLILCLVNRCNTKNSGGGEEVISLRDSLSRVLFGGRSNNHRHFIGTTNGKVTDVGPIHKSDLYVSYKNRHKDTDYGFLREYEMLPNRFSDRTTKNSDLKENTPKNRYPDIKAYDQTRVKLSQINGIQGSDYINANFVIGYKERKKFICAQGPMESTVSDFWRMIWEQHLEIIVMLTNLEEYNKTKCAKYWPEKITDLKQYGEITVKFMSEKKHGDYLIRTLDIYKRNAVNDDEEESRQITQYHYLVWKDFMAPEHPHALIKFIRHINAVYSVQRGPILVHCSAGVGRTGTLVALDSLLQQLEEEDQVSIFNTVCDLRHQRNFLVQSLKQYIFLYRALLDTAHLGNTEVSAIELSATVENLKLKPEDGREKCKLESEFEKLQTINDETNKTSSVGASEMNMAKNRSEHIIPYDRNRVILSPLPHKENSTYINASFIEGYDNSENFIITQDPMDNTIEDFWRMVLEQSITTIVMLSEIGEGPRRCPRYWADDEIQFDHIVVKYMESESCPYYTRREFNVTNCKINDTIKVTQLQYNGWPTVEGEVPEVCRGIIELVDQALNHYTKEKNVGCKSPLTVHCSLGTDRSSIFVAMCILVQQLRTEKSVDICTTARKIRSQRPRLIDTYAQYEFLYRAIVNYADLHKLNSE